MKIFLGIDASSTNTGVVALDENGCYLWATLITPNKKLTFEGRVLETFRTLRLLLSKHTIVRAGIEWSSFASRGKVADLAALNGYIYYSLLEQGVEISKLPPSTIKKAYQGKGNCKKEDMELATPSEIVSKFLLLSPKKIDDLVDAYAIAKVVYQTPTKV